MVVVVQFVRVVVVDDGSIRWWRTTSWTVLTRPPAIVNGWLLGRIGEVVAIVVVVVSCSKLVVVDDSSSDGGGRRRGRRPKTAVVVVVVGCSEEVVVSGDC